MESIQAGTVHDPFVQMPLLQSVPATHWPMGGHFIGHVPPQSTSASSPLVTPSAQVGATHTLAGQTRLWQSAETPQVLPLAQRAHEPPQSTSVSAPFLTVSPHPAIWQIPLVQMPPMQLAPRPPQDRPAPHLFGHEPPQSASVSSPFLTPSLHVAARQVRFGPHTSVTQSPAVRQPPPTAQRCIGAQGPPQSVSVSEPFLARSPHDAA